MRVRRMTADDLPRVAELCEQLGYPSTVEQVARRFAALSSSEDDALLVAESRGEGIVGLVHLQVSRAIEADARVEVKGLVVDERARGRGVGRLLMAEADWFAEARGLGEVFLRSNVIRERAHRFYRALGYEQSPKTSFSFRKAW